MPPSSARKDQPAASWLEGVDVEGPGSRFTSRVGFAVLTRKGGASPMFEGSDTGDAEAVVAEVLGNLPADTTSALGEHVAIQGGYGRGASSWIPVVEFAAEATVAGVIGGAAWEALKAAPHQLRDLLDRLRRDEVSVLVSRGAAALLAIEHVADSGETGVLDVEAVQEPSAAAGGQPPELNYVGIEPWLVSLINEARTHRYVVAVSPAGEVIGSMRLPMDPQEAIYGFPPRD